MKDRPTWLWLPLSFLLCFLVFSVYVAVRLDDVNKLKVQMRWIERKFDQGKLLVLDEETLIDMQAHGFDVEPMVIIAPVAKEKKDVD